MVLAANQTIRGNSGYVYEDGDWLTNVYSCEATVSQDFEDVERSGTNWTGKKAGPVSGEGTLTAYKVNSRFIRAIGAHARGEAPHITELITKVEDPVLVGAERIRLKSVQFGSIPLANFEAGSIMEQELPFVFEDYELLDEISE